MDIGGNDMFSHMEIFDDDNNIILEKFDADMAGLEKVDEQTVVTEMHEDGADGETCLLETRVIGEISLSKKADGETLMDKVEGEVDGEICLLTKGVVNETVVLDKGVAKMDLLEKGAGGETVLLNEGVGEKDDGDTGDKADGTEQKLVQKPIYVDEYLSPTVNMVVPNNVPYVIYLEVADPNVAYKNNDKKRDRKWSRFLGSQYTYLISRRKKKKSKNRTSLNLDYIYFTTFLKNIDQVRYKGSTSRILEYDSSHAFDSTNHSPA
ncbi:hypothetical protein Ddye_006163 [Dipteronia dyeriana]|uniref:Uncharacterized protein n=1 Tax=Dipteronia dyeriana TaxID=168575 RepID=A0AAD9XHV9_9ROSI|nr:hypothetical protein Ddye_006163 [Dipteronia dyeriana]